MISFYSQKLTTFKKSFIISFRFDISNLSAREQDYYLYIGLQKTRQNALIPH